MDVREIGLTSLCGVGKKRAELFGTLGLKTVADLFSFFPRTYIDLSNPVPISSLQDGENAVVFARVISPVRVARVKGNRTLYKFMVSDGTANLQITLFNQEYTAQKMKEGLSFIFYGQSVLTGRRFEMTSPLIEDENNAVIVPVYRLTKGLSQHILRKTVDVALNQYLADVSEILPDCILKKYELMPVRAAYVCIHHPPDMESLHRAQMRFVFEELFLFMLGVCTIRTARQMRAGTPMVKPCDMQVFFSSLPYTFTAAQKRAFDECVADLQKQTPMARMIQGDVGCGKTAVAAAVLYYVAKNGKQGCLMAPTEILAVQHYDFFQPLFAQHGLCCRLLTGSTKSAERKEILSDLQSGRIDLLIGTHAVIEDRVVFKDLALTVTDEQHRFGVGQRSKLTGKGLAHTLVMSATPIPRTLAFIIYGELDVSVIDELPPGRKPVSTFLVGTDYHVRMYRYLREQIQQGVQAYIVCPLVEEGEIQSLKSAVDYAKELTDMFLRGVSVRYLHGRMRGKEKEETLRAFAAGEIKVLVSTTVIEVGVNVPNASIMIIENAERFGLSQLHQLRGRVGRGTKKSYCFLVSDTKSMQTRERLDAFCSTNDGFEISRKDLQMRGPGDFFGQRQSGLPAFRHADLIRDMHILKSARDAAEEITAAPEWLSDYKFVKLKQAVLHLFDRTDYNIFS